MLDARDPRRLALALTALAALGSPCLAATPKAVVAAGRGWPTLNLSDALPASGEQTKLADVGLEPLSLAAADFDGDGLPDLAIGYRTESGGLVRVLRADVDHLFENSPSARARREAGSPALHPFAGEIARVSLPVAPDFLAAGDLDGDRRADLVAAERDKRSAVVAIQKAEGFDVSTRSLGGAVTAFAGGELDLRDGLLDVAVGVAGAAGPSVALARGRVDGEVAFDERLALAGPAHAMALGELDNDAGWDLAIATDDGVEVFHGRTVDPQGAHLRTTLEIPGGATEVAIGDLLDGASPSEMARNELAALDRDGAVSLFALGEDLPTLKSIRSAAPVEGATRLTVAHVASGPRSRLVMVDLASPGLLVAEAKGGAPVRLDAVAEPVAVLPMRLTKHPLDGLVMLLAGETAPIILKGGPVDIHVVTVGGSASDCNTVDGICNTMDPMLMTCTGPCTLRAAINQANTTGGLHEIDFNLAGAGPHVVDSGGEPAATSLTIDGTSEPNYSGDPVVWHVSLGTLNLNTGSFTVRGMGLGAATGSSNVRGAMLGPSSSNSFVEGNWIGPLGPDPGPTSGILTQGGSSTVHVGGTGPGMGNVIWRATSNELQLSGTGHEVAGNWIGFDPDGQTQLGQALHSESVNISSATNVQLGLAGVGNQIAGGTEASAAAVRVLNVSGVTLRSNTIGLDFDGAPTGNVSYGVEIGQAAPGSAVGGTVAGDGNVISGNGLSGVWAAQDGLLNFFGNRIGVGADGSDRGNGGHGILVDTVTGSSRIGGTGAGEANVIGFNAGDGVRVNLGWAHRMRRNAIFQNDGLAVELCSGGGGCGGPDVNDALDADGGDWMGHGNQHQNYPAISAITETTATGSLASAASKTYDLDFFANAACDASGYGEGRRYLGSKQVTTNGSGNAAFTADLDVPVPAGWVVTATATDVASLDTSELSLCSGPMLTGVIFLDGFESGNTSAWSAAVP